MYPRKIGGHFFSYVITNIKIKNNEENKMGQINVRKRGKVYEYFFEGAKVNNKIKIRI